MPQEKNSLLSAKKTNSLFFLNVLPFVTLRVLNPTSHVFHHAGFPKQPCLTPPAGTRTPECERGEEEKRKR